MAGETIDAYPSPVMVVVHPARYADGQPSEIDVINTSNVAITSVDLYLPIFTDPDATWKLRVPPCDGFAICMGAPFAVDPGLSRPVGFRCPRGIMPAESVTGQLDVVAHFSNGSTATDSVTITCRAPFPMESQMFANNVVFMTTQVGTTSDAVLKVTSNYTGVPAPVLVHPIGDPMHFEVVGCVPPCSTTNAQDVSINVRCHPMDAGPHFTSLPLEGSSGQMTTATLICTGTNMFVPQVDGVPVDGDGVPVNGDGVPIDAPNIGPGGPGNNGDPTSFYACSATAVAGLVPIVFAIVLASLRRRRRA